MSLIWTTSPDHAEHLSSLSDESFIDAVNDAYVGAFSYFYSAQLNLKLLT
jgi:hypothetical protein